MTSPSRPILRQRRIIEWDDLRVASTHSPMSTAPGPIFLAGVDRSGIGLLGELLEAHPDVAISRRTNFWSFYYQRFGDLERPQNLDRCVTQMLRYTRIQALHPDRDDLLERVRQGQATYARLFAALQEQHLDRLGKSRWGDKSLDAEKHADIIFREFPNAVMLHVIRDPRDRYASQATHRRAARGEVGSGVALWRWSVRHARRNKSRHPGRYLVVRYEDLVTRPREVLALICTFVGVQFTSEMLDVAFTTASIGRYRRDLSPREIAFISLVAGRWMVDLDYAADQARLPWQDCLLYCLIDVPRNLARMELWWIRRAWADRTASRPSTRRLVGS